MKQLLIFSLFLLSCTKTQIIKIDKTNTKEVHDTILIQKSLIGKWFTWIPDQLNPTFYKDSFDFNNQQKYKYIASLDSIYIVYGNEIQTVWYYKISNSNDTLIMTSIFPQRTTVYTRTY